MMMMPLFAIIARYAADAALSLISLLFRHAAAYAIITCHTCCHAIINIDAMRFIFAVRRY